MKNTIIFSAIAWMLYMTTQVCGCGSKANAQTSLQENKQQTETKTVTLKITGMTCGGCAKHIHSALSKKDGIIENEVKYPDGVAVIKYDPKKITVSDIIKTIEKSGYKAQEKNDNEKRKD